MDYKQLFLFVEGPDDERFFTKIIKPSLEKTYSFVKIISYATMPKESVVGLLKTIQKYPKIRLN